MFTLRFPFTLTWFDLWTADTFPQIPLESILSRRFMAHYTITVVEVRERGIVVVAVGAADKALIVVERTPAQRAGGVARRFLPSVVRFIRIILKLTARPLPHIAGHVQ